MTISSTSRKKQEDDAADLIRSVTEKLNDLRRSVQKATGRVEDGWFGNLLLGILNSASLDHYTPR